MVGVPAGWVIPAGGMPNVGGKEGGKLKGGLRGRNLRLRGQAGTLVGIWEAAVRGLGQGTGRGLAGDWLLR